MHAGRRYTFPKISASQQSQIFLSFSYLGNKGIVRCCFGERS